MTTERKLLWKAIDNRGRVLGRGWFTSYGRAFVAARRKFGDRFSAVLADLTGQPKRPADYAAPVYSEGREFPSWDAGR